MRIFGLHWAWHLLYLAMLAGLCFFEGNRLSQTAFLKNELGEVQQLILPEINRFGEGSLNRVDMITIAYPIPQHNQIRSDAIQAAALVRAFAEKSRKACERLRHGTQPDQINWSNEMLDDFYQLGDSLSVIYEPDSARKVWLDRCLFSSYRAFPPQQLACMLAASDTTDASRLCLNLQLKAELALLLTLESLRKKVQSYEMNFEGLIPVVAYHECPHVGVPFKADIFLASFSRSLENVTMKVNGKPIPVDAGLGHYIHTFTRSGGHKLPVEILVRNPLTGETKHYIKEFGAFVPEALKER